MSEVSSANNSFPRIWRRWDGEAYVVPPGHVLDARRKVALGADVEAHRQLTPSPCLTTSTASSPVAPEEQIQQQCVRTAYVYNPFRFSMQFRTGPVCDVCLRYGGRNATHRLSSSGRHSAEAKQEDEKRGPSTHPVILSEGAHCCRCSLNVGNLFLRPATDVPTPPTPIAKCELHEILRALPPRFQNHPWRLCYDTSRDGSSLRNFYRAMEPVYQAKECGIGIFFLTTRPTSEAAGTSPNDSGRPATEGNHVHRRVAKPMGIVGCFTPKVPCLESHDAGQHAFYGSPETFVFRLRLAGKRTNYNGLSLKAVTSSLEHPPALSSREHSVRGSAHRPSCGQEKKDLSVDRMDLGTARVDASAAASTKASSPFCSHALATGNMGSFGIARSAFIDTETANLILPTPTRRSRMTEERSVSDGAAVTGNPAYLDHTQQDSQSSPLADASSPLANERKGAVSGDLGQQAARGAGEPLGTSTPTSSTPAYSGFHSKTASATGLTPPPEGAPPLLEKFSWCGNPAKRQFVLAQNHFFAIGGGHDGAALYVDENLQYCTSSVHCDTFDAPPLFAGPPAPGLRHTEAVVVRMVWFAVRDTKESAGDRAACHDEEFRMMTYTPQEEEALAEEHGMTGEEVSRCGCGRVNTHRLPFHHCNDGFFAF